MPEFRRGRIQSQYRLRESISVVGRSGRGVLMTRNSMVSPTIVNKNRMGSAARRRAAARDACYLEFS
jgi:hypothetical protein